MKYFLYLSIFLSIAADPAIALAQSSQSGRDQSLKRVIDTCVLRIDYLFVRAVDTVSGQRYRDHRRLEVGSRYTRDYSLLPTGRTAWPSRPTARMPMPESISTAGCDPKSGVSVRIIIWIIPARGS